MLNVRRGLKILWWVLALSACSNPLGGNNSSVTTSPFSTPVVPGSGTPPTINECPTTPTGSISIPLIYSSSGISATSCVVSSQSANFQGTPTCNCVAGACSVSGLSLTTSFLTSMVPGINSVISNGITYSVTAGGLSSNVGSVNVTVTTGTWNPNCLSSSGMNLWVDAQDSTTLFQDTAGTIPATNGGKVGLWRDKSGNGYDASQATGAKQPTWSSNTLVFGGNASATMMNSLMTLSQFTATNQGSMFSVLTPAAGNVSYGGVAGFRVMAGNLTGLIVANGGTQFGVDWWSNGIYSWQPGDTFSNGTTAVVGFVNNGATQNMSYNGTIYNTAVATTVIPGAQLTTLAIGQDTSSAARYYSGNISELVIVGAALSVATRQQLEGYLAWKWGTQASLAAGQPYLSFAP